MITSTRNKIIEELSAKLLNKIRPTIWFLKRYYSDYLLNEDYRALVKEALWIASDKGNNKEKIFKNAYSIITKWLYADVSSKLKEKRKRKIRIDSDLEYINSHGSIHLDQDYAWGEENRDQVNSGVSQEDMIVAISPEITDKNLYLKDSAKYLYKILKYIMEHWGPHSLVWFVMAGLNDSSYIATLKQFGIPEAEIPSMGNHLKQGERTINRIKEDIKEQFNLGKLI